MNRRSARGLCGVWLWSILSVNALAVERFRVEVLDSRPQPRDHFVQGLEIAGGDLYVSSGLYGHSRLLRYDFNTGKLKNRINLNRRFFAEGVTVLGEEVFQLTWRNRRMLVYDRTSLTPQRQVSLPGEGWGLTNDGGALIYSDGSHRLFWMDPTSGRRLQTLNVTEAGVPVTRLNELEWIDGQIWANVWRTDRIVVIDPTTGSVTASIDLTDILPIKERTPDTGVLNGIARNPADGGIWITGKRWPLMYRIEVLPTKENSEQFDLETR